MPICRRLPAMAIGAAVLAAPALAIASGTHPAVPAKPSARHAAPSSGDHFASTSWNTISLSVSAPAGGATLTSATPIAATVRATSGVRAVSFYLDGALQRRDAAAPFTWSLRPSSFTIGRHTVRIVALSVAGSRDIVYRTYRFARPGTVKTRPPVTPAPAPDPAPDPTTDPAPAEPPSLDPGVVPVTPPATSTAGVLEQTWRGITTLGPIGASAQGPLASRQLARPDSLVASNDVARVAGRLAAKFTVQDGDQPGSSSGERAEIYTGGNGRGTEFEGTSGYYAFSVFFPAGFQSPSWTIVHQMHGASSGTSPAVDFLVDHDRFLVLRRGGSLSSVVKTQWQVEPSVTRGVWHDFVYFVRWAPDSRGVLKVWHRIPSQNPNWTAVADATGAIGYGSAGNYVRPYPKFGIYRSSTESGTTTVYNGGFRLHAPTFADAASIFN